MEFAHGQGSADLVKGKGVDWLGTACPPPHPCKHPYPPFSKSPRLLLPQACPSLPFMRLKLTPGNQPSASFHLFVCVCSNLQGTGLLEWAAVCEHSRPCAQAGRCACICGPVHGWKKHQLTQFMMHLIIFIHECILVCFHASMHSSVCSHGHLRPAPTPCSCTTFPCPMPKPSCFHFGALLPCCCATQHPPHPTPAGQTSTYGAEAGLQGLETVIWRIGWATKTNHAPRWLSTARTGAW